MYVLTITIAQTNVAQRFVPKNNGPIDNSNTAFQNMLPQNSGANNMWIGDYLVSNLNGIKLTPLGSFNGINPLAYASDLKDFYVYGTAGDTLTLMIFP